MNRVIETNLSMNDKGQITDHQSRIIQVESWEKYIREIKNGETMYRMSYLGSLHGCSLPKFCRVENLVFDDFHMSCDVHHTFFKDMKVATKKFAYLVD